jgi:hypothetical protein
MASNGTICNILFAVLVLQIVGFMTMLIVGLATENGGLTGGSFGIFGSIFGTLPGYLQCKNLPPSHHFSMPFLSQGSRAAIEEQNMA